jgi:hypothetical protein
MNLSADEREVGLPDRTNPKTLHEHVVRSGIEREEHYPGGVAIETMHDPRAARYPVGEAVPDRPREKIARGTGRGDAVLPFHRVRRHAGRFGDREQPARVKDFPRQRLGAAGGFGHLDDVPVFYKVASAPAATRNPHGTYPEESIDRMAAEVRPRHEEKAVETKAVLVFRDFVTTVGGCHRLHSRRLPKCAATCTS